MTQQRDESLENNDELNVRTGQGGVGGAPAVQRGAHLQGAAQTSQDGAAQRQSQQGAPSGRQGGMQQSQGFSQGDGQVTAAVLGNPHANPYARNPNGSAAEGEASAHSNTPTNEEDARSAQQTFGNGRSQLNSGDAGNNPPAGEQMGAAPFGNQQLAESPGKSAGFIDQGGYRASQDAAAYRGNDYESPETQAFQREQQRRQFHEKK